MRSINQKAPVTCSKTIRIQADIQKVWAVLTHIDKWANWQSAINKAKLNGEVNAGTTFEWKSGGITIYSRLHTVEPFREFGWTGKTLGMFAIHNWTLSETDGITTVEVAESMEGILAIVFKKSFTKNLAKGMEKWLHLLKEECEK